MARGERKENKFKIIQKGLEKAVGYQLFHWRRLLYGHRGQ
jgi:hypothetical protein